MPLSIEQRLRHGSRRQRRRGRVLERYGWVCQLCGGPIDPKLKSRHPFGLTFDHIVPISRGGSRVAGGNLWPAHLACNQAKAARLPGEAIDVSVGWSALAAENAALRARVNELEALLVVGEPDARQ